jgi:chaperone required for assembly of F1-ATPase
MTGWAPRRFWTEARIEAGAQGWEVRLDGRAVRTPAKAPLVLPTRALAEAIAGEWREQGDRIDPRTMPLTRAANAAIDKVAPQRAEIAAMLAAYGETDLLCHRAEGPAELVRRQASAWDPLLGWAAETLGAPLVVTAGVISVPQPAASLVRLAAEVEALGPFELAAFHDLVALSGSLVIGLAALRGAGEGAALWQASRIDETWQAELWGADAEAAAAGAERRRDFLQALRFLDLCRAPAAG